MHLLSKKNLMFRVCFAPHDIIFLPIFWVKCLFIHCLIILKRVSLIKGSSSSVSGPSHPPAIIHASMPSTQV